MTTAIRLYRTYILSTFVPLNTIRTITQLFNDYGRAESHIPHKMHETSPQNCLQRGSLMC